MTSAGYELLKSNKISEYLLRLDSRARSDVLRNIITSGDIPVFNITANYFDIHVFQRDDPLCPDTHYYDGLILFNKEWPETGEITLDVILDIYEIEFIGATALFNGEVFRFGIAFDGSRRQTKDKVNFFVFLVDASKYINFHNCKKKSVFISENICRDSTIYRFNQSPTYIEPLVLKLQNASNGLASAFQIFRDGMHSLSLTEEGRNPINATAISAISNAFRAIGRNLDE